MTHRGLLFLLKKDWALGALCHHLLHPWIKAVKAKSNTGRQAEPQATVLKTGDFTDLLCPLKDHKAFAIGTALEGNIPTVLSVTICLSSFV